MTVADLPYFPSQLLSKSFAIIKGLQAAILLLASPLTVLVGSQL